jgi:hypothetical protein
MNGENLAEYADLLAAEARLGHQHANDGWGIFDDDNIVGTNFFMQTLELLMVLQDPDQAGLSAAVVGSGTEGHFRIRSRGMDIGLQPAAWHEFFALVGTASAALAGLFFVAISLHFREVDASGQR